MTAQYPDAVYTPRTKANKAGVVYDAEKTTIGYSEDVTKLDEEVVAIQNTLGTNPEGAYATVKAWLTALAGSVIAHKTTHENGGTDEISVAGLSGTLADAQTPTAHQSSHEHDGSDPITGAGIEVEKAIAFSFDGGGSAIATSTTLDIQIPFKCQILAWTILLDQSATFEVDIWKDTYANYPATGADSICGGNNPTTSAGTKATDSTFADWTTLTINAGDCIRVNVEVNNNATKAVLILKVKLIE